MSGAFRHTARVVRDWWMVLAPLAAVAAAWSEPVAAGAILAAAFVVGCVATAGAMLRSRPETGSATSAAGSLALATTDAGAEARTGPTGSAGRPSADGLRRSA